MKIKLTEELLNQGRSDRGGLTRDQLFLVGAGCAPLKGWKKRLIGTEVEQEAFDAFLRLRSPRKKKDRTNALHRHIAREMRAEKQAIRSSRKQQRRQKLENGRVERNARFKKAPKRNAFYDSDVWKRLRYKVLRKLGAICQCCGFGRQHGKVMHVDHIKPRSLYPELELDENNLQVLCEDCNLGKGNTDSIDWRTPERVGIAAG